MRRVIGMVVLSASLITAAGPAASAADQQPTHLCISVVMDPGTKLSAETLTAAIVAGEVVIQAVGQASSCISGSGQAVGPGANLGASPLPSPDTSGLPAIIVEPEYDTCGLVSDDEMRDIFHRELMMPSYGTSAGGLHNCTYSFFLDPIEMAIVSTVSESSFDSMKSIGREVQGIGDTAFWLEGLGLYVMNNGKGLSITVMTSTVDAKDAAIRIAKLALPRMK